MAVDCQNIYKNARKSAGFTQEKAAQLLSVSVDSLRDYEQSQRPVPSDVASAMCDVYQAPYLAVQHLRLSSELGKRVVPEIELKDLPEAVIGVLAAVQKFIIKRDAMIEIVADGKIEEDEQAEWNEIMDRMNNLFVAMANMDMRTTRTMRITAGAALASRSTTKSTACTATMLCIRPDALFSITRTSRKAPLWLISTAHGASRSICAFVKS